MTIKEFKRDYPHKANCHKCGGSGETMAQDIFALMCWKCVAEKHAADVTGMAKRLGELVFEIMPEERETCPFWDDVCPRAVARIRELKTMALESVMVESVSKLTIANLNRRITMLECERGPGIKAPEPIQTCDTGMDWED